MRKSALWPSLMILLAFTAYSALFLVRLEMQGPKDGGADRKIFISEILDTAKSRVAEHQINWLPSAASAFPDVDEYKFELKWPEFEMPEISWPRITLPEFNVRLPKIDWPEISLPEIETPKIEMPEIKVPEINWPSISLPVFDLKFTLSDFRIPEINLPDVGMPSVYLPELHIPDIRPVVSNWATDKEFDLAIIDLGVIEGGIRQIVMWDHRVSVIVNAKFAGLIGRPVSAQHLSNIEPASGLNIETVSTADLDLQAVTDESSERVSYPVEDPRITAEAVLVPKRSTVISSSRDGQIRQINFDNGDLFKKGDVLIEYECSDLEAQLAAILSEETLSRQKALSSMKLLKLEIMSDIENLTLETEQKKAEAERKSLQQRLSSCTIKADYDGRVTNRLANPGEYTRTDRVLMEVASLETLEAEFILPSRWLRWVNTGAPVIINIYETGKRYDAVINRIHGEIDPISRSIQMSAELGKYEAPLLPGMSGEVTVDVRAVRELGIQGFLETGGL